MLNSIREHNPKSIVTILLIGLFFLFVTPTQAVDNFTSDQSINYQVEENGSSSVNYKINLTNKYALVFVKEYILTIPTTISSEITATDQTGNILKSIKRQNGTTSIVLSFNDPSVGKDATTSFQINYRLNNIITTKGKTKELELPQTPSSDSTTINIKLPQTFGHLSYSSQKPSSIINTPTHQEIELKINKSNQNSILLAFGNNQLFDFQLSYFLSNPNNKTTNQEIAIPPTVSGQRVVYESIIPIPQNIIADIDGNWLAQYTLSPFQEINIKIKGQVKIIPESTTSPQPSLSEYTKSSTFWPTQNPIITDIASKYNSPRSIYDYTVSTLTYDYNLINNASRRGAIKSLENKNSALCTDFSDLFVTLARANKIPSREVEGFAYSNNPKVKPTNTNADVLHAWPQFYDSQKSIWRSVDPTWENTTNGIDYFSDLDLNHFIFVIHGISDIYPPPPGSYRNKNHEKSVEVNFASNEIIPDILPLKWENNQLINPNIIGLSSVKLTSPTQNWTKTISILPPLSHLEIALPAASFPEILLPRSKSMIISITSPQFTRPQTLTIQNQEHYFYLIAVIAISIIILTGLGIIITKSK